MERWQEENSEEELSPTLYDFKRPCWKCGAAKLEALHDPVVVCWTARLLGFQLCECAGCHRKRLSRMSVWREAS